MVDRRIINLSENCLMKKILCLICLFSISFYSCAVRNYLSSKSDLTERIVKENRITCLMITHNLKMALATGNRTLIMNKGRIIKELDEVTKKGMDINELLSVFKDSLNDDRILLDNN